VQKPAAGTLAGLAVEKDQPILIRDARKDFATLGLVRDAFGTVDERSILVAPMRSQGKVFGALSVQSAKPNAYDEGDLELLCAIANEAAAAIVPECLTIAHSPALETPPRKKYTMISHFQCALWTTGRP